MPSATPGVLVDSASRARTRPGGAVASRLIRTTLLATLPTLTVLAVAGCSAGAEPTVASAGGAAQASSGTPDDVAAYLAGQQAFVDCMRDAGVDYSDPDENGEFEDLDPAQPGDADDKNGDSPQQQAADVCTLLMVAAPDSIIEAITPPRTDEQIAQDGAFATCMQTSGVPDYPDASLDPTSPRADPSAQAPAPPTDDPAYHQAEESCTASAYGIEPGSAVG